MYYQLNSPDVTAEVFDEEVLVINLRSGHYHSVRGAAVPLWRLVSTGLSLDAAAAALAKDYGVDAGRLRADLETFTAAAVAAHIWVPASPTGPSLVGENPSPVARGAYVEPVLETYTDMKDMLLLDPIHDVDVTGWPAKPTQ